MEQLIKNIILGYDFSPQATAAAQVALQLARRVNATVHVLTALPGHIQPEVVEGARQSQPKVGDALDRNVAMVEYTTRRLQLALQGLGAEGLVLTYDVSLERPSRAFHDASTVYQADLVVVGATGLGKLERFLVGSTSEGLVRKSRWPVMVVKPDQLWPPNRILCPVDFSAASRRALGWAGELATYFGARVDVLHVQETIPRQWADIYSDFESSSALEQQRARTDDILSNLYAFCDVDDFKGVAWEPHILSGDPDEVIHDTARRLGTELICMGSVGRTGVEGFLVGNTAERVLRNLPCSLLTVKPDEFSIERGWMPLGGGPSSV